MVEALQHLHLGPHARFVPLDLLLGNDLQRNILRDTRTMFLPARWRQRRRRRALVHNRQVQEVFGVDFMRLRPMIFLTARRGRGLGRGRLGLRLPSHVRN